MTLTDIAFFFVLLLMIYAVVVHLDVSRRARLAAKKYCDKHDVQFLDQSVVLSHMSIGRSTRSLFLLKRQYQFEFASTGDRRYKGHITLHGQRVVEVELEPYKTS